MKTLWCPHWFHHSGKTGFQKVTHRGVQAMGARVDIGLRLGINNININIRYCLGLFVVTCQTRQLLRSNRKNSVAASCNLNISNGHPLVPRCRVILEHLPGKRLLLIVRGAKITSDV